MWYRDAGGLNHSPITMISYYRDSREQRFLRSKASRNSSHYTTRWRYRLCQKLIAESYIYPHFTGEVESTSLTLLLWHVPTTRLPHCYIFSCSQFSPRWGSSRQTGQLGEQAPGNSSSQTQKRTSTRGNNPRNRCSKPIQARDSGIPPFHCVRNSQQNFPATESAGFSASQAA